MRPTCFALAAGISIISVLFGYQECRAGNFDIPLPAAAQAAAEIGLKTLRELGKDNEMEAQRLGFHSSDEKAQAELGHPLPVFVLPPKQLSASQPPINLVALAQQAILFIYPVTAGVGGPVRSSLMVKQSRSDKPSWQVVQFGAANLIRLLEEHKLKSNPDLILWLPGLDRYFLVQLGEKESLLIPIVSEFVKGFIAGETISGDEVFKKLRAEAARFLEAAQNKQFGADQRRKQGGSK